VQWLWSTVGDVENQALWSLLHQAQLASLQPIDAQSSIAFHRITSNRSRETFPRSNSLPQNNEALEQLKHAPAIPGVIEVILKRWSPRAYSDKPVSPESLKEVFEAARWAASSFNEQPWRFLVGHRGDETYKKIFDSLVEFNQSWAKSAPVLILSVAKKTFTGNGSPNQFAQHDTGAATAYLALQATALGFHTHSMAGFDHDKALKSFNIPADYEAGSVTALGYLGDPNALPDQMRQTETSPRQRKPLNEIVFEAWEKPLKF
jgi:nitroreductase